MSTATIAEIKLYQLNASTGRPIRKATMVRFSDGYEVKFLDRMSNRSARAQAIEYREREARADYKVGAVTVTANQLPRLNRFEDSLCPDCDQVIGIHVIGRRIAVIETDCDCTFDQVMVEAVVTDLERQFAVDNPENYSDGGTYLGRQYNQFTF